MKILLALLLCAFNASAQIQGAILTGTFGSNQVSTPTTSNSGGSCSGSDIAGWGCSAATTVSLHVASPGSGVTICYTTSGATPTISGTSCTGSSITYSSGFTVASSATVKAIAGASGYTPSGVMSVNYTINTNTTLIAGSSCEFPVNYGCTGQSVTMQVNDVLYAITSEWSSGIYCGGGNDVTLSGAGSVGTWTNVTLPSGTSLPGSGNSCAGNGTAVSGMTLVFKLTATSAGTVTPAMSYVNPGLGALGVFQIRPGSPPLNVDLLLQNNEGANGLAVALPCSGSACNPNAANATTSHANEIFLGWAITQYIAGISPTTNGCFGVTGSTMSNFSTATYLSMQYTPLATSGTSGNCNFTIGSGHGNQDFQGIGISVY